MDASAQRLTLAERDRILHEAAGNPLALIELPARPDEGPDDEGSDLAEISVA
jgi:hypothetical protein